MNVGELIAKLQTFPADLPVLVDGYEFGVNEVSDGNVLMTNFVCDYHGGGTSIYGRHEYVDEAHNIDPGKIFPGVAISRWFGDDE